MSVIGSGLALFSRIARHNITRMEPNPHDKCTIVSVYPKRIHEVKATISPGIFIIEGAADGDFEILVVGSSSWWREINEDEPPLEIPCSSYQVAKAIVNDYVGALLGSSGTNQRPGLFFIPGEWNKKSIMGYVDDKTKKSFPQLLSEARTAQINYYKQLIIIADKDWARYNHNPLAIADDARLAAEKLGVSKNKDWMQDYKTYEQVTCKSCGSMVNPAYPICHHCTNPISGISQKVG